jgi:hypothetical protein
MNHVDAQIPEGIIKLDEVDFDTDNFEPKPQVGGTHYKMKIQPIEYIEANKLDYHEANVVKYISRHRNKNGKEDIEKAIWYLNRILEIEYA